MVQLLVLGLFKIGNENDRFSFPGKIIFYLFFKRAATTLHHSFAHIVFLLFFVFLISLFIRSNPSLFIWLALSMVLFIFSCFTFLPHLGQKLLSFKSIIFLHSGHSYFHLLLDI